MRKTTNVNPDKPAKEALKWILKNDNVFFFGGQGLLILVLILAILWCFWHFALGIILNLISFQFFVLLPGLMITRMVFLFRSRRSVGAKVWRCVVCAGLLICALFFGMFSPYQIHRSTRDNARDRFLHAIENSKRSEAFGSPELGAPESMCYHYYRTGAAIFESHAHILLCRYSPDDYATEKDSLEAQYEFRTEPLIGNVSMNGENALLLKPYARIGDDEFRFLYPWDGANEYGARYFKGCLLFVTNDETHEIAFVSFDDDELDEAVNLAQFLYEDCGWRLIRK